MNLLDNNDVHAPYYMEQGEKEIKDIIENPAFSRGMIYSLHTYMDMKMKYSRRGDQLLSYDEIDYIANHLIAIPKDTMDNYMCEIKNEFIEYTKNIGREKAIQKSMKYDFGKIHEGTVEDYKIENLDLF